MNQSWIQIGIVGKAHGLRGAFFISQRDDALPSGIKFLKVGPQPDSARLLTLSESRRAGDRIVVQCSEITSRESAEALKMQPLWCERKYLPIEPDTEYLWADLVGKAVFDAEAVFFGHIKAVANFGASDVVRIEAADGRWTEIPFVAYYFDMNFMPTSVSLAMVVAAATFEDTWNKS